MVVLKLNYLFNCYILLLIIQEGTGNQENNVREVTKANSDRQYEAEAYFQTPIRSEDSLREYLSNMRKGKNGRCKKRAAEPNLLTGSFGTGLLLPTRITAPMDPVNLSLNQGVMPTLNENIIGVPGFDISLNAVPYPLFVLNPMGIDSTLYNLQNQKRPFDVMNSIPNDRNYNNVMNTPKSINIKSNKNVDSVSTDAINNKDRLNCINNSNDLIDNTALKNNYNIPTSPSDIGNKEKINIFKTKQNVKEGNVNMKDITDSKTLHNNEANKKNVALPKHEDDSFLKNITIEKLNVPVLCNNTDLENIHIEDNIETLNALSEPIREKEDVKGNKSVKTDVLKACDKNKSNNIEKATVNKVNDCPRKPDNIIHKLDPSSIIIENKETTQLSNFATKPKEIKYIPIERVTSTQNDFENEQENYGATKDIISDNTNDFQYPSENEDIYSNQYQNYENTQDNQGSYSKNNGLDQTNYLDTISITQDYGKTIPVFTYPMTNIDIYQHPYPENMPVNIMIDNENNIRYAYNRNGNKAQTNTRSIFNNPLVSGNLNSYQYLVPENLKTQTNKLHYNEDDLRHVCNVNKNMGLQYNNISPDYNSPVEYQSACEEIEIPENYQGFSSANELKYINENLNSAQGYINISSEGKETNSDNFNLQDPIDNETYNNNLTTCKYHKQYSNNPRFINMNLNYGKSVPKRIQCHCNQHRSLIDGYGFYRNQNALVLYPAYFYYPWIYRNKPH